MYGTFQVPPSVTGGFLGLLIAICLITLVLVILDAVWMYRDAQSRRMDATVWVVLLVLASVFGGLLGLAIVTVSTSSSAGTTRSAAVIRSDSVRILAPPIPQPPPVPSAGAR